MINVKEINVYIYRKNRKGNNSGKMEYMKMLFDNLKKDKINVYLENLLRGLKNEGFTTKENPMKTIKKIGGICYTYNDIEITICLKDEKDKDYIDGLSMLKVNKVTAYENKKGERLYEII